MNSREARLPTPSVQNREQALAHSWFASNPPRRDLRAATQLWAPGSEGILPYAAATEFVLRAGALFSPSYPNEHVRLSQAGATRREKYLTSAWGKRYIKARLTSYLTG